MRSHRRHREALLALSISLDHSSQHFASQTIAETDRLLTEDVGSFVDKITISNEKLALQLFSTLSYISAGRVVVVLAAGLVAMAIQFTMSWILVTAFWLLVITNVLLILPLSLISERLDCVNKKLEDASNDFHTERHSFKSKICRMEETMKYDVIAAVSQEIEAREKFRNARRLI